MLPSQISYVMVTVSDMARSVAFYRDVLGLPLRFESPQWTEFETPGTTLALHGGGVPATYQPGEPPAGSVVPGVSNSVHCGDSKRSGSPSTSR
jgi:catechol 2,3-dioxygenase-like lactoylglutathione lyase family enzyme